MARQDSTRTDTVTLDGYRRDDLCAWLRREAGRKEQDGMYTHQRRLLAAADALEAESAGTDHLP